MTSLLRHLSLFLLFISLCCLPTVLLQDDTEPVSIEPFRLSIEVGESEVITCSLTETFKDQSVESIIWLDPQGVDIAQLNTSLHYSNDTQGQINLVDANIEDSGTYTCMVTLRDVKADSGVTVEATPILQYNKTFWLNVYVMPTYLREGMIVLGLNLGLLLVFAALVTHTLLVDRRRLAKYGRIAN